MKSGAQESTVEISIEIDKKANILLGLDPAKVSKIASAGKWHIFDRTYRRRILWIIPAEGHQVRVIDRNGVVCFQREGLGLISTTKKNLENDLAVLLESVLSMEIDLLTDDDKIIMLAVK